MSRTGSLARILLTGARAPVTLELARLFAARGHTVFIAESLTLPICRFSRSVRASLTVPAPNSDLEGFARGLAGVIEEFQIDVLVPTCEESFQVARVRERLPTQCRVLCADLELLRQLHSKHTFIELSRSLDLAAPATRRVTTRAALEEAILGDAPVVLKREFSRFSCGTLVRPTDPAVLEGLEISEDVPWVIQEFLPGEQVCTYSVAHEGRLLAHAAYATEWTAGQGATVAFAHVEHTAIEAWIETFVEATGYSGQIAFDFIVRPDGSALPIECNPRATSGAHLFQPGDGLCEALLGERTERASPAPTYRAMVALGMLLYALPAALIGGRLGEWTREFFSARDVTFRWSDPVPVVGQLLSYLEFGRMAMRAGTSLLEASTIDIEWNGDGDALPPESTG